MRTKLDVIEHTSIPFCLHDDYDYTLPLPYVYVVKAISRLADLNSPMFNWGPEGCGYWML